MPDISDILAALSGQQATAPPRGPSLADKLAEFAKTSNRPLQQPATIKVQGKDVQIPATVGGTAQNYADLVGDGSMDPQLKQNLIDKVNGGLQPRVIDGPGGKYHIFANGQQVFMPEGIKGNVQVGDVNAPTFTTADENGNLKTQAVVPNNGGGGGASAASGPLSLKTPFPGTIEGMQENQQTNKEIKMQRDAAAKGVSTGIENSITSAGAGAQDAVNSQQGLTALSQLLSDGEIAKLPVGPGSKEYREILGKANTAFQLMGLPQLKAEELGKADLYNAIKANMINGIKGTDSQVAKMFEADPSLDKNPLALKQIVDYKKAQNAQKVGLAQLHIKMQQGKIDPAQYMTEVSKYISENPAVLPGSGKNIPLPSNQNPNGPTDPTKPSERLGDTIRKKAKIISVE